MPYDPRNPHHLRYVAGFTPSAERLTQLEEYCVKICEALSYDFNTIEFAVEKDIPYAIDFMNPAPDAEKGSVQEDNFEWILDTMSSYLVELAHEGRRIPSEYTWSEFVNTKNIAAAKRHNKK